MKRISLTNGGFAIVDDKNFKWLRQYRWNRRRRRKGKYYATCSVCRKGIITRYRMHGLIVGARRGEVVDHKDGDGLNNLESNLRKCTNPENTRNQEKHSNNKSGFKGVHWDKSRGKWKAQIMWNRKQYHLLASDSKEDCAINYNVAAQIFFGEFARLNDV